MKKLLFISLVAILALSVGLVGCGATEYTLTIGSTTGGSTTPAAGTYAYLGGDVVDLEATADAGYVFLGWTGETDTIADASDPTTTITMNGDYFIEASFQQITVPTSALVNPQGYPADPSQMPQYGGTLIVLHSNAPGNLGAYWMPGGGWDAPMSRPALEKLIGLSPEGELEPQLATDWELNESAKTITLTLREGVMFHDGTDFDAEAVKWCLDQYIAGPNTDINLVETVDVTGNYEVRLTLSEWDPGLIRALQSTGAGVIVSPTAAEANGANARWIPVGTGPFEFVEYVTDIRVVYEAFEDYWQEGLPYLDGVEIHFVPDAVTRKLAFQNGEGHVMNEFSTSDALQLKSAGYEVLGRVVHVKGVVPDSTEPPFDDIRIRQAMAYGFPTATEVVEIFDDQYPYTNQCALPGANGYNTDIEGYPFDPDEARALMQAAGYGPSNRLATTLSYTAGDATDYFTVWQNYMADIYIDVTLNLMDRRSYSGASASGWDGLLEFQFSYNGFELLYDGSLTMCMTPGSSKHIDIDYPQDYVDKYNEMLLETDAAAREELYQEINKMAIDDYCLALPQLGYLILSARQASVHDWGYGVSATEYCPEAAWLSE